FWILEYHKGMPIQEKSESDVKRLCEVTAYRIGSTSAVIKDTSMTYEAHVQKFDLNEL
ncbi:Hypothetical predicted protein, partial [Mytilus galloprovincialis]